MKKLCGIEWEELRLIVVFSLFIPDERLLIPKDLI